VKQDTSPAQQERYFDRLRRLTPLEHLQIVSRLNRGVRRMAMAGIRRRHPTPTKTKCASGLSCVFMEGLPPSGPSPRCQLMRNDPGQENVVDIALRVGKALDAAGARYMLVGSVVGSLQGDARATNDVDFVAALLPSAVDRFCAALGDEFDIDAPSLTDAMASGGSWNIFFTPWMLKCVLFVADGSEFQRTQLVRALQLNIGDAELIVLRAEDVVLSKLIWFQAGGGVSDQQSRDVLGVLRLNRAALDLPYLRAWASERGIAGLREQAMSEAV